MALSKLKKVDLRQAWGHEALDFTKWLALPENLSLLGDEVDCDITLIQTEADCGDFNVDILAQEENTGKKIIIENQLEVTDHDHLGKIITYASGHDAKVIIWVVKDVREQHRQAIDWLNEHTDEGIEFYLLKIEVYQIDDSPFAPKFEIVCKPNDWAKTVKDSAGRRELTETKLRQLKFWDEFKEYGKRTQTKLKLRKSNPQHWTDISVGSSDAHISLTINSKEKLLGVELYIPENKELYAKLFSEKEKIERELGEVVKWMELPDKKASRIKVSYPADFNEEGNWDVYFYWLSTMADKFATVFPKYLKTHEA